MMEEIEQNYKIFFVSIVLHLLSLPATAQFFSCSEIGNRSNLSTNEYYTPQLSFYTEYFNNNSEIGFYNFSLLTETWGQAYAGIVIKPVQWLAVSLGAGFETDKNPYRYNITVQMKKINLVFFKFTNMVVQAYGIIFY
jgi:hypothetical protein